MTSDGQGGRSWLLWPLAIWSLASTLAYLWLANKMRFGPDFNDETEKLVAIRMIAAGHHIYRDVFSQHGPMAFLLGHLVYIITHASDIAVFRIAPLLLSVSVLVALVFGPLLQHWRGRLAALSIATTILTLCQALWSLDMGMYQVEAGDFFALTLLLWIMPMLLRRPVSRGAAAAGGFALGCAFFCAYSFALACFFLMLAVFACLFYAPKPVRGNLWRWLQWGVTGGIASVALMAAWLAVYGDLFGYIAYHVIFNQRDYAAYAFAGGYDATLILKMIVPVWGYFYIHGRFFGSETRWDLSILSAEAIYLCMWVFVSAFVERLQRHRVYSRLQLGTLWLLMMLGVIYTNPRGAWDFHASTMVVTVAAIMAAACGMIVEGQGDMRAPRWPKIGVAVALLATVSWFCYIQTRARTYIWDQTPLDYALMRGQLKESRADVYEVVRRLVPPGEPIEALPFDPIRYILANRLPASGYFYALPWQMDYARHPIGDYKIDLCRDIDQAAPKAIFFDNSILIWNFRTSDYLGCVHDYLVQNYVRYMSEDNLWIRADAALANPDLLEKATVDPAMDLSRYSVEAQPRLATQILRFAPFRADGTDSCLAPLPQGSEHEPLALASCAGGAGLKLGVYQMGDRLRLVSEGRYDCVEVVGAAQAAGQPLRLWPCTDSANQYFSRTPDGRIRIPYDGLCVAAADGRLVQEDCGTAPAWQLDRP